ncbi:MAG: FKBP-type peptidyl-prolyl cis-trans isomerase, partial [Deltaproteobacteria bacterium]|nr:FKBP-type peptidyl-prolyl cis-trans isomerase [Kofleriaceae bacterium]
MRAEGCAYRTPEGLGYRVIAARDGLDRPRPHDTVTLRMSGWSHDGDALPMPASPTRFRVSSLIPGFVHGLGLMTVGERWMLCIPEELAYQGRPGSPGGMLVFDVELLAIDRALER